jgi:cell division septal protein FtsQ
LVFSALTFSKKFEISNVTITTDNNFSEQSIRSIIDRELKREKFIFKGNNIIWFDSKRVKQELLREFPFESVTISKKPLHEIRVQVIEKKAFIVWEVEDTYYTLDKEGIVIRDNTPVDTTLPQVVSESNKRFTIGEWVLEKSKVSFIQEINRKIKERSNLSITEFRMVHPNSTDIKATTNLGFFLYLPFTLDIHTLLANLDLIMKQKITHLDTPIEYIDLRSANNTIYIK